MEVALAQGVSASTAIKSRNRVERFCIRIAQMSLDGQRITMVLRCDLAKDQLNGSSGAVLGVCPRTGTDPPLPVCCTEPEPMGSKMGQSPFGDRPLKPLPTR